MQSSDLEYFRKWFYQYIEGFYGDDDYVNANLDLKRVHTGYVVQEARSIAAGIGLGENDKLTAEAIALFHDLGRFEQFTKYRTYSDHKSVNHSDIAIRVLNENEVLNNLPQSEQKLIALAIKFHNIKELPLNLDDSTLLQAKIVRDADKLDIYRVLIEKYHQYKTESPDFKLEIGYPDEPWYSDSIIQAILKGQQVHYFDLKTLNDMKLLVIAMIFDVNFLPTFQKIRENRYLEQFFEMLPNENAIIKAKNAVFYYLEQKMAK